MKKENWEAAEVILKKIKKIEDNICIMEELLGGGIENVTISGKGKPDGWPIELLLEINAKDSRFIQNFLKKMLDANRTELDLLYSDFEKA